MAKLIFGFIIIALIGLSNSQTYAQADPSLNTFGYKLLNYQENYLPEKLLSSRSAVFVSTLPKANGSRGDWKALLNKAHDYLKKIEIDAIAYFHNEDVFSGAEPRSTFIQWIGNRKVENLIFLSERLVNGQKEYLIVITPFSAGHELAAHAQPAWKYQHADLERLFVVLYRHVNSTKLKRENLLIVDKPEIFTDIPLKNGKRFEAYQQDLKLDKLAVPLFNKIVVPEQFPDNNLNQEIAREIEQYNRNVESANEQLQQIMSSYPFGYELVDMNNKTPEQLRNAGFQFILYHMVTTGNHIKDLLDYRIDNTGTAFVSIVAGTEGTSVKPIAADLPVYKFYIRHIFTNDLFLGTKWDADTDWQQALINHIAGLKTELKIR